jgi:hypothetical protein
MIFFYGVAMLICAIPSFAQPNMPTRTVTVEYLQTINFGAFCVLGSEGSVNLNYNGTRTSTGGIHLISQGEADQPGIISLKLCPGRNVQLVFTPEVKLYYGSNYITMEINSIEGLGVGNIYTSTADCDFNNHIRIGGTLSVPANAPPGLYEGSFTITFNMQ